MEPVHDLAAEASAPWWLKPAYVFGMPAAIALFLVWFVTGIVASGQTFVTAVVANGQAKLQATLDQHITAMQVERAEAQALDAKMLLLWGFICENTSQTERERNQCKAVTR